MKARAYFTKMLIFCLFAAGVMSGNTCQAQHLLLDRLSIDELNGKVYISCIVKAGNTCNGIVLYRATDTTDFIPIDKIFGICGSLTSPQGYDFVDEHPVKNHVNYYRIELGGYGFSETLSIQIIDTGEDGMLVSPNPVSSKASIYFANASDAETRVRIYDGKGIIVREWVSHSNMVEFDTSDVPAGMYYVEVFQEKKYFKKAGKIIVLH